MGDIFSCLERKSIKLVLIVETRLFLNKDNFKFEISFKNFKNLLPFSEFIAIPFLLHSSIIQLFLFTTLEQVESKKAYAKLYSFM